VGERWTKSIASGTNKHSIVISGTPPSVAAAVTSSSSPSQGQSVAISGSSRYIELEPIAGAIRGNQWEQPLHRARAHMQQPEHRQREGVQCRRVARSMHQPSGSQIRVCFQIRVGCQRR